MRSPYQIIKQEAIDQYDLSSKIWNITISNDKIGNLVAFNDRNIYDEFVEHSIDKISFDINNYKNKKAFIIPGSERTKKRIIDMMNDLDIKIVKDYENADFFISNNNHNFNFSQNSIFYKVYGQFYNTNECTIYPYGNSGYNRKIRHNYIGGLYFNLRFTGKDFVPLYHFLKISQDVVLDEDMVEYLTGMIESNNKDDISVVKKILPKIDVSKNQNILFKFFDDCLTRYKYSFQRDKDVRNWIEESGVMEWHREPSSIIEDYHNRGVLSNEGFKYLEAKNREGIYISGGSLYNFKVSLKDEYKKYLK